MCYSFAASVNASAALGLVGAATVYRAWRQDRRMLGFAVFPLVFSLHQASEGVVWWSVTHPFQGAEAFRYVYTAIAFLVWPVLTPFAAALAETDPARRKIWTYMYHLGALLALYLTVLLVTAGGIALSVHKHSLAYDPGFDRPPAIVDLAYLALTVVPLVAFENRALRIFGVLVFATFVYALSQNRPAWYSLWCMAAAVFSFVIAFAVKQDEKSSRDEEVSA